jgi:hypothetical protein
MIVSYNNQVSHKPSIVDSIIKLGVDSAPLIDTLGSKNIQSYLHSWITDRYRDAQDNARLEVSDLGDLPTPTKQKTSNQCQIVISEFGVSERQKHISQYGEKELDYQRAKVGIEHIKDLEYAILGLGNSDVFAAPKAMTQTAKGRMAGFFYFVPNDNRFNGDTGGNGNEDDFTELTFDIFQSMLEPIWKVGGIDDGSFRVYMGNKLKNKVNSWFSTHPHLRTIVKDGTVNPLVTKIETDFGTVDIYLHRQFAGDALKDKVLIGKFDEAKLAFLTQTKLEEVTTSKTATYERYYTDFTLEVTNADFFACGSGLK